MPKASGIPNPHSRSAADIGQVAVEVKTGPGAGNRFSSCLTGHCIAAGLTASVALTDNLSAFADCALRIRSGAVINQSAIGIFASW
jgi:hypothetical protein